MAFLAACGVSVTEIANRMNKGDPRRAKTKAYERAKEREREKNTRR